MMKNLLIGLAIIHKDGKVLIGARTEKADGDLKELKWVPATSVTEYFTTSVSDEVMG